MRLNINNMASKVLSDITEVVKSEKGKAEQIVEDLARDTCERVKQKSPKKTGKYARGWKVKSEVQYGNKYYIVTNTTRPFLTIILEGGTVPRKTESGANRGVVKKQPHIRAAFDEVVAEYENKYLK